jgi:menaquinol-cytochrome c reductase cytochrome b/c subunit
MALSRIEERRSEFQRYKDDVKERGKPFYPYAMFHDTVMSLVVVSVIIALACIWKFTSGESPDDTGWLGPRYAEPADPGTTNFVPRPDWYFYFLFYLLRIFKWPETVLLGTIGVPTIALMLALGLPFLDTRRERRLLRRPVALIAAILVVLSMGVLTYKGATAKEALASEVKQAVPSWAKKEGFATSKEAVAGANLFATSGCTACHTYLATGSSNLGAPDLTSEGAKHKGVQFQVDHLKCPSCVNPGSPMPSFKSFPESDLRKIATFLEASKGQSGSGGGSGFPWDVVVPIGIAALFVLAFIGISLARERRPRVA